MTVQYLLLLLCTRSVVQNCSILSHAFIIKHVPSRCSTLNLRNNKVSFKRLSRCVNHHISLKSSASDDDQIDLSNMNLDLFDIGEGRSEEVKQFTVSDISKNSEWLGYIDRDQYKAPPEYIPESVLEDFAPPQIKDVSDQIIIDNSNIDFSTLSSEDIRRAVFDDEMGFLSQSTDFRKSLSGDEASASVAQAKRRGERLIESNDRIMRDLNRDIEEFSKRLKNSVTDEHTHTCAKCGAIKFLSQPSNGNWICKVCTDGAVFTEHKVKQKRKANISKFSSNNRSSNDSVQNGAKVQKKFSAGEQRFARASMAANKFTLTNKQSIKRKGVIENIDKRRVLRESQRLPKHTLGNLNQPRRMERGESRKVSMRPVVENDTYESSSQDEIDRLKKEVEELRAQILKTKKSQNDDIVF